MSSLYEVLGVLSDAPAEVIKAAYKGLASKHHPDKGGDKGEFQILQSAYEVLKDTAKRKRYDETGNSDVKPIQSVEQKAFAMLSASASQVIKKSRFARLDYSKQIKQHLQASVKSAEQNILQIDEQIGDIEHLMLYTKGDAIIAALTQNLHATQQGRVQMEGNIEVANFAIEILTGYSYDGPAPEPVDEFLGSCGFHHAPTYP